MNKSFSVKILGILLIGLFCWQAAPVFAATTVTTKTPVKKVVVPAKKVVVKKVVKADEKMFAEAPTRCLTPTMKSLYAQALKQMALDVQKTKPGYQEAIANYKKDLETVWSAMFEPYCGYGSNRLVAVQKSFQKSVIKTRARFQNALKAPPKLEELTPAELTAESPSQPIQF